ncbi:MAG: hypothetical protein PVJ72_00820 [Gammaproteobacteria bacterium]|jgi:hypothetical protein
MNTAKYSSISNSNRIYRVISLTLFYLTIVVLFGITGCFDSSTEDSNNDNGEQLKTTIGQLPRNHTESVAGALHAPGRFTPYSAWCTACHGSTLQGDADLGVPSCTACHVQMWTETAPPTGSGRNPPSNHTDNVKGFLHAAGKDTPYTHWCTACHGPALEGDLDSGTPPCTTCHAEVWTETPPTGGGGTSNPPSNHTDDINGFLHGTGKDTPYTSWCTACHGPALEGNLDTGAPSCTTCHGQLWTETTPPNGGGSTNNPPSNHTDNVQGFLHAAGKDTPFTHWCTVCHGPDLGGNLDTGAPSCTTCHGQLWTENAPPSGGGSTSNPPSNHTDDVKGFLHAIGKDTPYSNWCTACHGAALEGNLDLGAPSCTTCHGQLWTETTPPSSGGRTSNAPSNHTDDVNSFLHAPGKDTPYSSWCTACHGADLTGDIAPSCTACHAQVWSETTPPSSGGRTSNAPSNHTDNVNGFLHAAGKDTPYTHWCTACHGTDLTGDLGPSCTACHAQVWTETAPPSGGGSTSNPPSNHTDDVNGFLHGTGKDTPYSSWCTVCHGPALEGNLDLGAPSCTACHGQVWTETTPPSGGGSTNNPPSNHTDNVNGFLHAAGKDTPYTHWCTACHGPALEGDLNSGVPSCTACHDQVWTEAPPSGGGSTSNPPSNHTNNVSGFFHAPGNQTPYSSWCTACHGDALQGNLDLGAPSCTACHGQVWTETAPPSGGSSNPPSNHTNSISGFLHAPGNQTPYSSWCTACHGDALQGNLDLGAPSCTACHSEVWVETAPPSGGGSGSPPSNHTNNISGFQHAPGNETPYTSWCTACHGDALQGNLDLGAPSCTACHTVLWSETGGGSTGILPSSHTNNISGFLHAPGNETPYSSWCTVCHGSSLQGDLDLGAPACTACHAVLWSETGGGPTGNPPANHTDNQSGFLHAPGKETPYSSWCWGCHGSDLQGNPSMGAPPCTVCHTVLWSETSSAARRLPSNHTDSQDGYRHAPGKNNPYTNLCTVCHGADLRGYLAPSCYTCHGREWNESGP